MSDWIPLKENVYGIVVHFLNPMDVIGSLDGHEDAVLKMPILSLDIGSILHLIETCEGWFRGYVVTSSSRGIGIIPKPKVRVLVEPFDNELPPTPRRTSKPSIACKTIETTDLLHKGHPANFTWQTLPPFTRIFAPDLTPVAEELSCLLRDLLQSLKEALNNGNHDQSTRLFENIPKLLQSHRQLLSENLTEQEAIALKSLVSKQMTETAHFITPDFSVVRDAHQEPLTLKTSSLVRMAKNYMEFCLEENNERAENEGSTTFHVISKIVRFIPIQCCKTNEKVELHLMLYERQRSEFISENCVLEFSSQGTIFSLSRKVVELSVVFRNAATEERIDRLYLVCRVIRVGDMSVSKESAQSYRRPYAVGIINLESLIGETADFVETTITLCIPKEENTFAFFHELLAKEQSPNFIVAPEAVKILLRKLKGTTQSPPQIPETALQDIVLVPRIGFQEAVTPDVKRNSIYVQLMKGEFLQGRKTSGRNVEVRVELRDDGGNVILNAVRYACNKSNSDAFSSSVIYHCNSPNWLETITVDVPTDLMMRCHLFFRMRNCSSTETAEDKDDSFAFLPLMMDGKFKVVVPNGAITLNVYRMDSKGCEARAYLRFAHLYGATVQNEAGQKLLQSKESMTVKTLLCSTNFTNSIPLCQLQNHNLCDDAGLANTLKEFFLVPSSEIIVFLYNILDHIFEMFESKTNKDGKHSQMIFNSLVYALSTVENRNYGNFRHVLKIYIDNHFCDSDASGHLIKALRFLVCNTNDPALSKQLRDAMKVWEWIIQLAVRSIELKRMSPEMTLMKYKAKSQMFKIELQSLFDTLIAMMCQTSPDYIVTTQTIVLKCIPDIMNGISPYFEPEDLAKLIIKFNDASAHLHSKIPVNRLGVMVRLFKNSLFDHPPSRILLTDAIANWSIEYAVNRETNENLNNTHILSATSLVWLELVDICLYKNGQQTEAYDEILFKLFPYVVKQLQQILEGRKIAPKHKRDLSVSSIKSSNQSLSVHGETIYEIHLSTLFLSFCFAFKEKHWKTLLNEEIGQSIATLNQCCDCCREILRLKVVPEEWGNIFQAMLQAFLSFVEETLFAVSYFSDIQPSKQIMGLVFDLTEAAFRKHKLKNLTNYVRQLASNEFQANVLQTFKKVWKVISPKFLSSPDLNLLLCILELSALYPQTRDHLLPLFSNFIATVLLETNVSKVKKLLCDSFDYLFIEKRLGEKEFQKTLLACLQTSLQSCSSVQPNTLSVFGFAESFSNIALSALDVSGDGLYEEQHALIMLKLAKFVRPINRDAFEKFVVQLVHVQKRLKYYEETANCILMHAEHLDWSDESDLKRLALLNFPAQTAAERKEMLYYLAISYFKKGKSWESAIKLTKELCEFYEYQKQDFEKLAECFQSLNKFYRSIATEKRFFCEYFRVGYYGLGFPDCLRDKQFICKGLELEKLSAFCERMQRKYPSALLLKSSQTPSENVKSSELCYIQVISVKPEAETSRMQTLAKSPEYVRLYYEYNEIDTFSSIRVIRKDSSSNEFLNLWTEKTTYVTDNQFPSVLRQHGIIATSTIELSPIQNAIEAIKNKNKELLRLVIQYYDQKPQDVNCNPLSMALNGAVDAPVNGGLPMYRDANPSDHQAVHQLKEEIFEQAKILKHCIRIHGIVVSEPMRPLHEVIAVAFLKTFALELERMRLEQKLESIQEIVDDEKFVSMEKKVKRSGASISRTASNANDRKDETSIETKSSTSPEAERQALPMRDRIWTRIRSKSGFFKS